MKYYLYVHFWLRTNGVWDLVQHDYFDIIMF